MEQQRKKTVDEEVKAKVQMMPKKELNMPGVPGPSMKSRIAAIELAVENRFGPVHADKIEGLRMDLNRDIDRQISESQSQDVGSETQKKSQANNQYSTKAEKTATEFKQNARDITKPKSRGRAARQQGGGKSRHM